MITLIVLFIATLFLAYSNGANDNFKGVATLFGSGTTSYRAAIIWATISTYAGSITSLFLAETLLKNFSGRGLVPNELAASPQFVLAVGLGAGLTVMLATVTGFPISTTHGLVGALVGAGLTAVGTSVNFAMLGTLFFLPLLASPLLIAMAIGGLMNARKVAITMSKRITPLNPGQGFTANLVTSALVILASRFGLPVSTTHVSVGSLFGIGLITREANRRVVSGILMSWLLTLPIAAILSAVIYAIVTL